MRALPLALAIGLSLAPLVAQNDEDLPEGPAVAWEDAFPAQAGFDRPLQVSFAASDPAVAFVVTQPGFVFRIPRDGSKAERATFLDLSKRVFLDHNEEGLLGFAFDPEYAANGFVYAYWTEKMPVTPGTMADGSTTRSNRRSVIARYTATKGEKGPWVDLASELRVMEIFQPFGNHNGGTLVFGPDQMLYVALGDGGAANDPFGNGQSKAVLLGKVLRIDVRGATKEKPYAVPADNPFVGEKGARGEIWCYGMRNPWRIAFDRASGDLWCADVGQNLVEEVDRLEKGGNYGWNGYEGKDPFELRKEGTPMPTGCIPPIAEYRHPTGLSITGGALYRGAKIPGLVGTFVYADYMTLRTWSVREDRAGGKHAVVRLNRVPMQPTSFGEEPDGEVLVTCFGGRNGKVFRMVPAPAAK